MEKHHIPSDSVTLINVEAADVPVMLARGDIIAGHTWDPYAAVAFRNGAVEWFSSKETPGLISDVIAFQGTVIRERAEEIQRLVQAWFQAADWWLEHPAEGHAIIEQY